MSDGPADSRQEADAFLKSMAAARDGSEVALGQILLTCRDYLLAVAEREMPADLRRKSERRMSCKRRCLPPSATFSVSKDMILSSS